MVTLKFKEAVTAIDFSPVLCDGRQVLLGPMMFVWFRIECGHTVDG